MGDLAIKLEFENIEKSFNVIDNEIPPYMKKFKVAKTQTVWPSSV